jgi:multicomponent Na+:H+ antiporter subunit E
MARTLALFVALMATWLLWSGLYKPLLLSLGLASCVLVVYLARRMDTIDKESVPVHLGWGVITYWGWLLKEIVVASLQISRLILSPELKISPRMLRVRALPKGEVTRVILANSITLTPGTLTTDIDDDGVITVHALTAETARGVEEGEMNRRVAALEKVEP